MIESDRKMLQDIKKACALACAAEIPVTFTWQQAAYILDSLQFLHDTGAEEALAKDQKENE